MCVCVRISEIENFSQTLRGREWNRIWVQFASKTYKNVNVIFQIKVYKNSTLKLLKHS